jgi:hypothetical protein
MTLKNLMHFNCRIRYKIPSVSIIRLSIRLLSILLFLTFSSSNVIGQEPNNKESLKFELQVAMVYKILDFIQWPHNSFESSTKKFRIGVLGNSPILESLKLLKEERIKGLQVQVELVENINKINNFHLLYACPTQINKMPSILKAAEGGKTLTLSKANGFAKKGGMINFYEDKGKMRFEINLDRVKKMGFKISSRVLALSKIISSEN